jgi:hypothetical protein
MCLLGLCVLFMLESAACVNHHSVEISQEFFNSCAEMSLQLADAGSMHIYSACIHIYVYIYIYIYIYNIIYIYIEIPVFTYIHGYGCKHRANIIRQTQHQLR